MNTQCEKCKDIGFFIEGTSISFCGCGQFPSQEEIEEAEAFLMREYGGIAAS